MSISVNILHVRRHTYISLGNNSKYLVIVDGAVRIKLCVVYCGVW